MRKPLSPISSSDITSTKEGLKWLDSVRSFVVDLREIDVTWNPASLAANTHAEETVTVTGLMIGDIILAIIKPTFTQGFQVGQGRVSAEDALDIQVVNGTGSASNPVSELYKVIYIKNIHFSRICLRIKTKYITIRRTFWFIFGFVGFGIP